MCAHPFSREAAPATDVCGPGPFFLAPASLVERNVGGLTRPAPRRLWLRALPFAVIGTCLIAGAAAAQSAGSEPVQPGSDPLQCWWRTSVPMVHVGETLSVVLTCSLVDSPTLSVVADEGKLAPEAISLAPFEILDGSRAADLRTNDRRFFQFHYRLRLVSDALFGSDVSIPGTTFSYRTRSRVANGTMLDGLERTYELPPLSVRVLSLVPPGATDIRDVPPATFRDLDSASFHAQTRTTAGGALMLVGGLLVVVALAAQLVRKRVKAPADASLPDRVLLKRLTREFADIRDERQRGWNPALTARALAAVRITAGYLLGRPPSQRGAQRSTPVEGSLLCVAGGMCVAVSSDVTPETVERERRLSSEPGHDEPRVLKSDRRGRLDSVHQALTVLTNACYRVPLELPEELLDPALTSGEALTRSLLRASTRSARLFAAASARATILNPRTWRT